MAGFTRKISATNFEDDQPLWNKRPRGSGSSSSSTVRPLSADDRWNDRLLSNEIDDEGPLTGIFHPEQEEYYPGLSPITNEDRQYIHKKTLNQIENLQRGQLRKKLLAYFEKMNRTATPAHTIWHSQVAMAKNDKEVCEQVGANYKHFFVFGHGLKDYTTPQIKLSDTFKKPTILNTTRDGLQMRVNTSIVDTMRDVKGKTFSNIFCSLDPVSFPAITNFSTDDDQYSNLKIDFEMYSDEEGRELYNLGIYDMDFIWKKFYKFIETLNRWEVLLPEPSSPPRVKYALKIKFLYVTDDCYKEWHSPNVLTILPADGDQWQIEDNYYKIFQGFFKHVFFNLVKNEDGTKCNSGPRDSRIKYFAPKIKIKVQYNKDNVWKPIPDSFSFDPLRDFRSFLTNQRNNETRLSDVFSNIPNFVPKGLKLDVCVCNTTRIRQPDIDAQQTRIHLRRTLACGDHVLSDHTRGSYGFVSLHQYNPRSSGGNKKVGKKRTRKRRKKRTRRRKKRSMKRKKRRKKVGKKRTMRRKKVGKKRTRRRKKRRRKKKTRRRKKKQ